MGWWWSTTSQEPCKAFQYYHMARTTPNGGGFTREIGGWEWFLGVPPNSVDVSLVVEEEVREWVCVRCISLVCQFDSVRLRPSLSLFRLFSLRSPFVWMKLQLSPLFTFIFPDFTYWTGLVCIPLVGQIEYIEPPEKHQRSARRIEVCFICFFRERWLSTSKTS